MILLLPLILLCTSCNNDILYKEVAIIYPGEGVGPTIPSGASVDDAASLLPWPLPHPTTWRVLDQKYFKTSRTIGDIANRITEALDSTSFTEYSFYKVENGLVIATKLMQFEDDGSPSKNAAPLTWNRLTKIIKQMLTAPPGHYRVVLFVVRPGGFYFNPKPPTEGQADDWVSGGKTLPDNETTSIRNTKEMRVTAVIYQFDKRHSDNKANFIEPEDSHIDAITHLSKSNILQNLQE